MKTYLEKFLRFRCWVWSYSFPKKELDSHAPVQALGGQAQPVKSSSSNTFKALRFKAIALRLEGRLEAIASRLEAIAPRLVGILIISPGGGLTREVSTR